MKALAARSLLVLGALGLVACSQPGGGDGGGTPGGRPAPPVAAGGGEDFACDPVDVPDGDFELMGDPRACLGGEIVMETNSFPSHLNHYGPERSASHKNRYSELMHNTLISVHRNTLEIVPELASSWEEIDGGKELVFHIDPDARWSDGKPVTAQDVKFTMDLIFNPAVVEVVYKISLENTGYVGTEVLSDATVKIKFDRSSWSNIIGMEDYFIMPSHAIDPETYLEDWRFSVPVHSGEYELGPYEEGGYISFDRKKDWWGNGKRQFIGKGNFDRVTWKYIRDSDLAFQAVKKGDIDFGLISKAQRWAEECDFDKTQKGWIQKVKMYQQQPEVPSQMAFNLEHPLFKDVRVRRGLMYLYNREYLIEELFFNQYTTKQSYWANSVYANPNNEHVSFDPRKGLKLLAEAGFTEKDTDGVLMRNGERLEFTFIYIHPTSDRVYTPIQETFRKYGVKMDLQLIAPSAWIKVMEKKSFEMVYSNWGSTPFPSPRSIWHSAGADQDNSNNVTRFRNDEVDRLIDEYEAEPELAKRIRIIQQMDAILYREQPYLLDWYAAFFRVLFWDKFGMPEWMAYAMQDIRDTCWLVWWYEPGRAERLEKARAADAPVPRRPEEHTYWKL